jgi:predicted nucleic acid-binding protein
MDTIYLETTIIGHLAGRILTDTLVAARQHVTRDWWENHAKNHRLFVSFLVIDECSAGNEVAAEERLKLINDIEVIGGSEEADALAEALLQANAIPYSEPRDSMHIALAASNGLKYLLTWNFKHIANAKMRWKIEETCRANGFDPPIICTPDELMGIADGN